jgi:serine/threonine protein kinase, bacterial
MSEPQWQFGRDYELLATYPEGVAGSIWLVRVQEDGSERAIKILRPELTGVAEVVGEFCALLDSVGALAHAGILVPDETVVHGNRVALVMPRIGGEDLGILLGRQQLLTPASTVLVFADVCDALAAAHGAGIVHGDVKPSNVLLEQDPETGTPRAVLLSDFGIAALAAHGGVEVLPAEYQAPEYGGGGQRPTAASDVYAVGAVLYAALAGHPPFTGAHPDEVARLHREAEPPRIPVLPDQLWLLVAACLSKHPDQRPVAAELAGLLRETAPTIVSLPALASQETIRIARIPAAPASKPAMPSMPAIPVISAMSSMPAQSAARTKSGKPTHAKPAASAVVLPVDVAQGQRQRQGQGEQVEPSEEGRRSVFSGARGAALAVVSGVAVVSVALALAHVAGESAPVTLTVGSATAPALALGSPSDQLTSTVTTTLSPSATQSASAEATSTPSPSASGASSSATPSASASAVSNSPSAGGSPGSSAGAGVSATPSTAASSTPPSKGPATVNWECASGTQRGGISKKACIGIGSDGALYVQGTFSVSNGQTISSIDVSIYGNRQLFDTTSESCDASSCSITGGPYEPAAGTYEAYAGIDNSGRNELSPSVSYQGG